MVRAPGVSYAGADPPNVVVLLADDSGWGDYGFTGNQAAVTPNIDSLAREGVVLDRFYVCPVCAPTRAEFLTGRYHPRVGVRGVSTGLERLNAGEPTLAEHFKGAGYATGAFGKWHNGSQWPYHPNARGFDRYFGFTSGHWGEYFDPPLERDGEPTRAKGYIADVLTTEALAFIERNRRRPFLCYLPFNTPHSPWAVPPEYWERYRDRPIEQRGSDGAAENLDTTRCALAMVENLDWNVGRVLRRLDELGLSRRTIVLYFSDNGPNSRRWNGGMKGIKGSTDEGGVRSACALRWPGRIRPGSRIHSIAGAIDLLPTLAGLAGVRVPPEPKLDGRNLTPLLLNRLVEWPERTIFSHQNGNVSARTQQYRLDQRGALFDMVADPAQARNVAAEQPQVAARLAAEVTAFRQEVLTGIRGRDDRPYPVGHPGSKRTPLPARDGVPHGGVRRSAPAPNCSYFVNWTSPDDSITWDVEVLRPGRYEAVLLYTCPESGPGSRIELSFGDRRLTGSVTPAWDPPLYTNQDTLPRPPAESRMKEFRPLRLGEIRLEAGRGLLKLRAVEVRGTRVMDLRELVLTRVQD